MLDEALASVVDGYSPVGGHIPVGGYSPPDAGSLVAALAAAISAAEPAVTSDEGRSARQHKYLEMALAAEADAEAAEAQSSPSTLSSPVQAACAALVGSVFENEVGGHKPRPLSARSLALLEESRALAERKEAYREAALEVGAQGGAATALQVMLGWVIDC